MFALRYHSIPISIIMPRRVFRHDVMVVRVITVSIYDTSSNCTHHARPPKPRSEIMTSPDLMNKWTSRDA
jgi:hypothetical protein